MNNNIVPLDIPPAKYQEFCDSPMVDIDRAWFKAHPHRAFRIRHPGKKELHVFDEWPDGRELLYPVIVVISLAEGARMRVPACLTILPDDNEETAMALAIAMSHEYPVLEKLLLQYKPQKPRSVFNH